MPFTSRTSLGQYLIEEARRFSGVSGDFNELILDVATACKAISAGVAHGQLANIHGYHEHASGASINVQGEQQQKLDVLSNDMFIEYTQWGGHLLGLASEEMDTPIDIPDTYPKGKYLLVFDPLDGSSNIDVNVSVGSIFSVLRAPAGAQAPVDEAMFLQPGAKQVAAGYAIYGPTTMLVLSVGNGVVGFTLHPVLGEFFLTHPAMTVPQDTQEFAINASNSRFWHPPVTRYVNECLAGKTGPRGKDFNTRWIASLVAETHRILTRGGVFLYPQDVKDPSKPGRLRLLYEANPVGMLIEQAGGRCSTGDMPMLDVEPSSLHQRIPLIFGSKNEVETLERYYREYREDTPLV
jgi:fructose-1,6-bisphosphatase I/sedoheptulose-1,7-bisphosphatase